MKSREYWAKRAAQRQYEYQKQADAVADELAKAYIAATNEIKTEIRKIFSGFKLEYGLSESAAFRLLTRRDSPNLYSLKSLVAAMEDGPAKKELQAILASPAYAYRIRRLQQLQKDIDKKIQEIAGTEEAITREHYVTLAGEAYDHSIFDVQKGTGIGFSFSEMPKSMVEEILRNKWSGALFSERIWKNLSVANQTIKEELLVGFMTGRSYRKTAKCIEKRMAVGSMEARRLVRTESTYIACMAELESCKEMGFKQYQYVATLDMRTSEMCAAMDRKIFDVEDGVPGYNMPPLHPWCRSTITAYMEERDLSRLTRSARDPETGRLYEVPADMTYEEWKKSLDKERGAGYVDKRRRMAANETADREQYDRYLKVLGKKNLPKTFDKFQDLKYNRSDVWSFVKLDYERQTALIKDPSLKLPNAEKATADDRKFTNYLFNPENSDGWGKGQAFISRLGYHKDNYEGLKMEIIEKSKRYPATLKKTDKFGNSYEQKMILYGNKGTPANVIVGWKEKDNKTWMTSAYIKEVEK